jgi:hypothetical protein
MTPADDLSFFSIPFWQLTHVMPAIFSFSVLFPDGFMPMPPFSKSRGEFFAFAFLIRRRAA